VFKVSFYGMVEEFPAVVRDIAYLRSKGMLSLTTFYNLMRRQGLTRTRALIIQGKVERGEYVIIDEEGNEIRPEEIENKLLTKVFKFEWMLKLKYTRRKHHQIHIQITVDGEIEKHEVFPEPIPMNIREKIANEFEKAFERYMKEFWFILVRLLRSKDLLDEYKSDTSEFKEVMEYYKDINEGLEGEITDIEFLVKRYEKAEWDRIRQYERDFEPYVTEALEEIVDWITETEMDFLRREIEKVREETKSRIERARIDVFKTRIERAEKVVDIKTIEKDLGEAFITGKITEKEYRELLSLLRERSARIFNQIVIRWCERIKRAETEGKLNEIMKRIMNTWTWKNFLFEPFRDKVIECERERRNELLKEAVKRKEITRERVLKRVESYFRRRKEEIMRTTRSVRDLRRLITRVRRSALSEEKKEELIKLIEDNIEKIQKESCERAWKTVETETDITKLRNLYYTIGNNRQNYEPCYDEIRKAIRSKIQKLRRESYRKRADEIINEFKESETFDRIAIVNRECDNILMLPLTVQYRVFRELINLAENRNELATIFNCLKNSPIWTEPKYSKWKSRLKKMIEEKEV